MDTTTESGRKHICHARPDDGLDVGATCCQRLASLERRGDDVVGATRRSVCVTELMPRGDDVYVT